MKQVADYDLIERLEDAPYRTLWKARAPSRLEVDDEWVAVVVLAQKISADGLVSLQGLLRTYASVQSRHLVPIHDAGHELGTVYYAERYSPIGNLAGSRRELDRRDRLRAVATAARGAHDLHEVGVAHENIRLSSIRMFDDGARLGDLSIAHVVNSSHGLTGTGALGSLVHQAPEIARGERPSRATDVFALGVSLHTALSGQTLFPSLEGRRLAEAIGAMVDPPAEVHPDLSDGEADVVSRCVAWDPVDRPATALDLAEELDRLGEETIGR